MIIFWFWTTNNVLYFHSSSVNVINDKSAKIEGKPTAVIDLSGAKNEDDNRYIVI